MIPAEPHPRPPRTADCLIAIGSSAGGPAALAAVLSALPKNFSAAVVIVQHLDQRFAPEMAKWLGRQCALPVALVREGDCPTVGQVFLAGTDDHLTLKAPDRLGYTPDPREYSHRPSVDVLFKSLVRLWPGQAVGVLLTGMGRDGAQGLKLLREKGYLTIAQDQMTSAVYGMPKAAAALKAAVEILPLALIGPRLVAALPARR